MALSILTIIDGLFVVPGPEAPDDGEIAESHVESGKYLKVSPWISADPLWKLSVSTLFPGTTEAQGGWERHGGQGV